MDKLYKDLCDKYYTDIELTLIDPHNTIKFNAHKCVLGCNSNYFHTLFKFGKEKNQTQITITVRDAKIAFDLISSFYEQKINSTNYPNWKYILEMIKCRSFFCLDNDTSLLYDIKVSTEGFELLLEVIE